jgi:hypothetical protein
LVRRSVTVIFSSWTPVAAFTARRELQAYLRRRLDTFINPLVYRISPGGAICSSLQPNPRPRSGNV